MKKIALRENLLLFLKGALAEDFKKDEWLLRTVCPLTVVGQLECSGRENEWVNPFEGPVEPALKRFLKMH